MKLITASLTAALVVCMTPLHAEVDLDNEDQRFSYGLGMMIGERVTKRYGEVDYDALMEGLKASHEGKETGITIEDAMKGLQAREQVLASRKSAAARAAGVSYLAKNRDKEGVTVTDSGLQYEVLEAGDGPKPSATDRVSVHYRGTLLDGTEFDSSYSRGNPAEFALNGVIPGWTEGLQLMNTGSKYRFVIPSDLAYGERGAGGDIGPGETLIFEVELLEIK